VSKRYQRSKVSEKTLLEMKMINWANDTTAYCFILIDERFE